MDDVGVWDPAELLTWLRFSPGRIALVADDLRGHISSFLAEQLLTPVYAAGRELMLPDPPASVEDVVERLSRTHIVVCDLDVLYWRPWLMLDPLRVMVAVARRSPPKIFSWPGEIENGVARYSRPGRPDFFEQRLAEAVVLRPTMVPTRFPDELPYRMERFA